MISPNSIFEYSLASEHDGPDLLTLYESDDFKGNISVLYTRRPNPYLSYLQEGEKVVFPIIRLKETGELCGGGCCVIRKAFVNGSVKSTGYLTGLKIKPAYRRRIPYIQDLYQKMFVLTKGDVDLFYTTILKDNTLAQRLFKQRRKNMPEYKFVQDYTVYCFKPKGKIRLSPGYRLEQGSCAGLDSFYKNHLSNYNLAPPIFDQLRWTQENIFALRDQTGRIKAACGIWNQQRYKQYIITKYRGIHKYLQHIPLEWLGYPNLPKENQIANYASLALFLVEDNDLEIARSFLIMLTKRVSQFDFFMLGLVMNHPLNTVFNQVKHVKYESKLYTVHNDHSHEQLDTRAISLEVGLL